MEFRYFMPTKVYFGRGVIEKNKNEMQKLGSKAFIVTGKSSSKLNGSLTQIQSALESLNIDYVIFDEVEENPSLETIEKAASLGKAENIQFVIGIGGGSPIDAAKAIAVFIKNPEISKDNIFTKERLQSIPMVAVPTTSGTGSEVTQYSIVTVHKEKTKRNLGQAVFPAIAYLDSSFTDHTPYEITLNTAIDAFTHLVESYLNTNATIMSDLYAQKGFELFKTCFSNLLRQELTMEFRDKVMMASMFGGIAIAHTGTSLPHGMGYVLTYQKGIPHGIANGILTVEYLKSFKDQSKITKMLKLLGMEEMDELEKLLSSFIKLDIKFTKEELSDYAVSFANNKDKLKNHPEEVNEQDIERIYVNSLV